MITKIDKGDFNLVLATTKKGKPNGHRIRVVGDTRTYSEATEFKDHEREYEEVE